MGVYDYLKGSCSECGEEIGADSGDVQIKWFVGEPDSGDCFRTFRPGDEFPVKLADGEYLAYDEWSYCACNSRKPLIATVAGGRFTGFIRESRVGKVEDLNYERHEIEAAVREALRRKGS